METLKYYLKLLKLTIHDKLGEVLIPFMRKHYPQVAFYRTVYTKIGRIDKWETYNLKGEKVPLLITPAIKKQMKRSSQGTK